MIERNRERTQEEISQLIIATWTPFWRLFAENSPDGWWQEVEGATLFSLGLPHPLFNQVADYESGMSPESVDRVCEQMNARGLPWFWFGKPSTESELIPQGVLDRGLVPVTSVKGMFFDCEKREIETEYPAELEVHEVQNREGVTAFAEAILPAYEMPPEFRCAFDYIHDRQGFFPNVPLRLFYGLWEGKPVAGSMVFFMEETAVIQCVGTQPEARGRGFAQAVVSACMQTAKEAGYRYIVLQASDMGYPVYLKMGYEEVFEQFVYMQLPPSEV